MAVRSPRRGLGGEPDTAALIAQILQASSDGSLPVDRLDACIEKISQQMNTLKAWGGCGPIDLLLTFRAFFAG